MHSPSMSFRRRSRWPHYQDMSDRTSTDCESALSPWPTVQPAAVPMGATAEVDTRTPLVSQAALADRLDVSIATLARARKQGVLNGYRVGGQWRYSEQQIADYLRRVEPPLRLYGRPSNGSHQS